MGRVLRGHARCSTHKLGENSGKDGGGCAGSGVRARYNLSPGDVSNTPTTVGGSVELASGG